jgi:hypothetical protein
MIQYICTRHAMVEIRSRLIENVIYILIYQTLQIKNVSKLQNMFIQFRLIKYVSVEVLLQIQYSLFNVAR